MKSQASQKKAALKQVRKVIRHDFRRGEKTEVKTKLSEMDELRKLAVQKLFHGIKTETGTPLATMLKMAFDLTSRNIPSDTETPMEIGFTNGMPEEQDAEDRKIASA